MDTTTNNLTIPDMLRDTYRKQLITVLQQKTSKYTPFVTWMSGASGKRVEFNTRGNTEVDFRVKRFEEKDPDELTFGKRAMIPVGFAKAMHWSEDDKILKGDFSVANQDFIEEMSYGFARKLDCLIIGSWWDDSNKRYTVATAGSNLNVKDSFYNGLGIGGILGPAYVGEHLVTPENVSMEAVTTDAEAYDGSNLKWEETTVIPYDYTESGTPEPTSMTKAKLLAAMRAMEMRDALDDGGVLNVAITPAMKYELMNDPFFQTKDHGYQVLKDGFFNSFLNIRFLVTRMVPQVEISTPEGTKTVYACPVWRTEDVYAAWWDNLKYEIVKPSMSYDEIVISAKGALGCARRRLNTVLTIHCAG